MAFKPIKDGKRRCPKCNGTNIKKNYFEEGMYRCDGCNHTYKEKTLGDY